MPTIKPSLTHVETRRNKIKKLAFKGLSRTEISRELDVPYNTVSIDLKQLGIIPVSNYNSKEN